MSLNDVPSKTPGENRVLDDCASAVIFERAKACKQRSFVLVKRQQTGALKTLEKLS